jgi:hypothetical protein
VDLLPYGYTHFRLAEYCDIKSQEAVLNKRVIVRERFNAVVAGFKALYSGDWIRHTGKEEFTEIVLLGGETKTMVLLMFKIEREEKTL